ncbi:FecR family protein [Zunongwangia endophytica]|uniref:FecR family protein n=1 Tax=Zunongwangia endophytica TaxID=1808945 RepID=A0ABV8H9Q0_9FLAO|nr:FecR domain-containing protein [Zunongwangia endophytica]MDN3594861.1 DUF4974 domain-containing protein [Zunongwangia endophytica]
MNNNKDYMLCKFEKQLLRRRILQSAAQLKKQKLKRKMARVFSISAAASLLCVIGLYYFFQSSLSSPKEDFVQHTPEVNSYDSEQVIVMLGEKKVILNNNENKIQYLSSGRKVIIEDDKFITLNSQQNDKIVLNTLIVPYGKRAQLKLSDGSEVWLNSGSKLIYPTIFNSENREVHLEGEAIFEIKHDHNKPFRVLTEYQNVEVLGTVFNISAYADDSIHHTALKSGSVRIAYKKSKYESFKITPGRIAEYHVRTGKSLNKHVDLSRYFSWRDGYFILKNEKLESIFTKLSRYYNIRINYTANSDVMQKRFSGRLHLNENIESVLKILQTSGFDFEIKDHSIIIK